MTVSSALTAALKKVVLDLEGDLRTRVESQPEVLGQWKQEHHAAVSRERTAMSWQEWRDDRVTQAAVTWVLTTVFVRFCEDNRLLSPVWIAGPADRRQEALDAELAYFRSNPEHTDREWLLQAVEHLQATKATKDLVESHSPLWTVSPSGQTVKRLIAFWRERTADGDLVWDLADEELSTRFLGDLYQDLSDYAKKTFALLQTPEFVEEFILDQTMEPALGERPLEGFRLIDPTCGSGHFLLGAFARLNDRWAKQAPGLEVQARVQLALDAVHGVDLNPFAVAIARFRLMVAALQASELTTLETAPAFTFHLVAGDSLLHGSAQLTMDLPGLVDRDATLSGFAYATEDLAALRTILEPGRYDVVVGNPPYITVKDKKLNAAYRALYSACKGTYALTVPFMERFFNLARSTRGDQPAGWVGQITSNSFMKREFGSRLIEDFLSKQDLRLIADASGARIPGFGTPTVVLVGRPQPPSSKTVKALLGVRGEPGQPADPAHGLVWRSIVDGASSPSLASDYITVSEVSHDKLATHPWNLSGGDVPSLLASMNAAAKSLGSKTEYVGYLGQTNSEGSFAAVRAALNRRRIERNLLKAGVSGECVRDWSIAQGESYIFPYVEGRLVDLPDFKFAYRWIWPNKTVNWARATFSKTTYRDEGRTWWEWHQVSAERSRSSSVIVYANISTHNHFVIDDNGLATNPTAPAIKLVDSIGARETIAIVGVLNSSVTCFWLKQNCQNKSGSGIGRGVQDERWMDRYQFNGITLQSFPLPEDLPTERAHRLDEVAKSASARFDALTNLDAPTPTSETLQSACMHVDAMLQRMIAEQEEMDWQVYRSYGLFDEDVTFSGGDVPGLRLGERAFEIALARSVAAGEESTAWFTRHRSTPITEMPRDWPKEYRDVVQRRLELIESNRFINLLERPEYKRRWTSEPWENRVEKALRGWLLDRLEDSTYWFDPQGRSVTRSVAQLSDAVSHDSDLVSVLLLWSGRKDRSVTQQLADLLDTESVPFLAAYRLKDTGLRKREAWENTWDLQRAEDRGESVGTIPVPPKYTSADFRKQSWWQHRGKLDVPKERFILYPDAGRETDSTQLLGWAGWDHAQQALALAAVIGEREGEGWADDRLVPLVAGLAELQPWVRQWHDETDATYGINLADYLDEELRGRAHQVGLTVDQVRAWTPPAASRGRRRKELS